MPVLREAWLALLIVHLLGFSASQYTGFALDFIRSRAREDLPLLFLLASLEFVISVMTSSLWLIVVAGTTDASLRLANAHSRPNGFPRPSHLRPLALTFGNFNQVLIEQVRAFAAILWRVPFLILPALIEYVRLSFVPFVVLFDPDYRQGRIDALTRSRQTIRGHFLLVLTAVCLSLFAPVLAESALQGDREPWVWVNPVGALSAMLLTLFINLFTSIFLFAIYRRLSKMANQAKDVIANQTAAPNPS